MSVVRATLLICVLIAIIMGGFFAVRVSNAVAWNQLTRTWDASDEKLATEFPVHAVRKFGNQTLVACDGWKSIDREHSTLVPFKVPGAAYVFSVFDTGSKRYVLCSTDNGVVLKKAQGRTWQDTKVPTPVYAQPENWQISAGDDNVALVADKGFYLLEGNQWSRVDTKENAAGNMLGNSLIKDGKIYGGFDNGEWGGSVSQTDCKTGASKDIFNNAFFPVVGLKRAADGKIWIACGVSHMGLESAALFYYDGGKVVTASEVVGMRSGLGMGAGTISAQEKPIYSERKNWDFEPTCFAGFDLDKDGNPIALSLEEGLMRYSNEKWQRITRSWHSGMYLGNLVVDGSTAVIPVWERGVIMYDMSNGRFKFILPPYCSTTK
ncbi:MAG TPA: hypothetical protein V6C81_10720 [Planktothrix sp.]|jgi:hypothetical protein